jgi:tRNA (guanine-N7-)-methyltransferase
MPIFHKCDLRLLPDGRPDRLFLLFPDPWAKSRHAKRRFVHPALLPLLARVLKPGAE